MHRMPIIDGKVWKPLQMPSQAEVIKNGPDNGKSVYVIEKTGEVIPDYEYSDALVFHLFHLAPI